MFLNNMAIGDIDTLVSGISFNLQFGKHTIRGFASHDLKEVSFWYEEARLYFTKETTRQILNQLDAEMTEPEEVEEQVDMHNVPFGYSENGFDWRTE